MSKTKKTNGGLRDRAELVPERISCVKPQGRGTRMIGSFLIATTVSLNTGLLLTAGVPALASESTARQIASAPELPARASLIYIDKKGKQAIPYSFHLARPFAEGLAPVLIDNQWGFIDREGSLKVGARFERAQSFSEGLAAVKVKGGWGYIDNTGKLALKASYAAADDFRGGTAVVHISKDSPDFPAKAQVKLKEILADQSTSGLKKALMAIAGSRKAGIIDRTGKFVIQPEYSTLENFAEDLCLAFRDQKCFFLDRSGKVKIAQEFDNARSFSNGLAAVEVKGKWGFITPSGRMAIKPQFEKIKDFHGELAPARLGGKWGFIDKKGVWEIEPKYDYVWEGFESGVAVVGKDMCPIESGGEEIAELGNSYIVSRKQGIGQDFDESTTPLELSYYSYPDLRFGLLDKKGVELTGMDFEQIGPLDNGLRVARHDGKYGFIDNLGGSVIKPNYKWASSFADELALVQEGQTKPRLVERNESLLKHNVPALVNDPALLQKDIDVTSEVISLDPTNAQAFRDRGYLKCSLGKFEESLSDFSEVIKLCPTSHEGYYWKGMAELELEKYKEAVVDFTSAMEVDNSKPQSYYGRAKALLRLGKPEVAARDIEHAIRLEDHPFYRGLRGEIYEKLGQMEKALPDLEIGRRAPQLNPWPSAPETQQQLEKKISRLEATIADERKAAGPPPKSPEKPTIERKLLAFNLTRLADEVDNLRRLKLREQKLLELEDLYGRSVKLRKEAISYLNCDASTDESCGAAIVYKNDLSNSLAQLAGWHMRVRQFKEANSLLAEALELAKSSGSKTKEADCLNDLGKVSLEQEDYPKAEEYFQKSLVLTEDPNNALSRIVRGQTLNAYSTLLRKEKKIVEAKIKMDEASKLLKFGMNLAFLPSPPLPENDASGPEMYEIALQCRSLGLIESSREYMQKAEEKADSSELKEKAKRFLVVHMPKAEVDLAVTKTYQKGRTAEAAGDFPSAEEMYKNCIAANADFEWAYEGLARLKRLQGELGTADKLIKKALSINPDYLEGWLEQARIYDERGEDQKAKEALDKAVSLDPESQLAQFENKYGSID